MIKDLTQGRTLPLIFAYSLPVWLGFLFQQFYTVVDTVIVGQFLGVEALAAVGATGSVNFLLVGFCMGLCGGFSIPIAQKFGAKDFSMMRTYILNIIVLCLFFSVIMTAFTVLTCKQILIWMLTPRNIIEDSAQYVRILFWGIPFTILYNISSGILRALGDSKTPLYFLLIASGLNIALDLVFITNFNMGVDGAALATIISQGISGILCVLYMIKKFPIIKIQKSEKIVGFRYFKALLLNGIPMGLQYSITAIGSVILQSSVNQLGSLAVAAFTAGSRSSMFLCTTFDALGTTMANFSGQNAGSGKYDRIREGLKDATLIALIYSVFAFILLFFLGDRLIQLIVGKSNMKVVEDAHLFLIINGAFYLPLAWVNIIRFSIQGMGYGPLAIFSGVFEMIARIFVALLLVPVFAFTAVCFASPIAWVLADVFLFAAFFSILKKREAFEKKKYLRN